MDRLVEERFLWQPGMRVGIPILAAGTKFPPL
jgi:hypothetical protein